ncbi:MAG: glycosyltransferase family 39 protein [Candidatus Eremiobacteraeota bacterium]|nr:glycosyltransferase family 39 protein [Candidatus Eremiobacteraeota bacterium]
MGKHVSLWSIALGAILLLALVLRLKGIHNPIIDHPGWRQGDEAAIARNFAHLQYNPLFPQTDYNGAPPNYVELELQIVPFLAATLYKLFGVHEIFGRLISIAFSLGTIAVLGFFARWLFVDALAGLFAAFLFAVMPGSLYYGRTFTPDTTMVFFLCAALYAGTRWFVEDEALSWRGWLRAAGLLTMALLAKPVSIVAIVPLAAIAVSRLRSGRTMRPLPIALLFLVPLAILFAYDRFESSIAEWHWASGITKLHVIPSMHAALTDAHAFAQKWQYFKDVLGMLSRTMLGPLCTALLVVGCIFFPTARSRELLLGWLAGALLYTYVVVTVERVDYYMYLWLPLAALLGAAALTRLVRAVERSSLDRALKTAAAAGGVLLLAFAIYQNRLAVRPYYTYSKAVYKNAVTLNQTLAPDVLIVMAHYDPSVLYYINRKGWEEDPYVWTPFDEQSAIRKGARYFIAIERNRFEKNVELYNWMQRFPVINPNATWPVYETDPTKIVPGAETRWKNFRKAEKAGNASQYVPKP